MMSCWFSFIHIKQIIGFHDLLRCWLRITLAHRITTSNKQRWKYSHSVLFLLASHILPTAVPVIADMMRFFCIYRRFRRRLHHLAIESHPNEFNGSGSVFPTCHFLDLWWDKISMDKNKRKTDNDILIHWYFREFGTVFQADLLSCCFVVLWFCWLTILLMIITTKQPSNQTTQPQNRPLQKAKKQVINSENDKKRIKSA